MDRVKLPLMGLNLTDKIPRAINSSVTTQSVDLIYPMLLTEFPKCLHKSKSYVISSQIFGIILSFSQ